MRRADHPPPEGLLRLPEIYNTLSSSLNQQAVVEMKMAWRCNMEQWWTARLKPEYAGPIYRKLGYDESYIQGLGLGDKDTSATFGAERIILDPRRRSRSVLCHPSPRTTSPAWFRTTTIGPRVSMECAPACVSTMTSSWGLQELLLCELCSVLVHRPRALLLHVHGCGWKARVSWLGSQSYFRRDNPQPPC